MGQASASASEGKVLSTTWDDDPYYIISLAVHRSRRYHSKMSDFYQLLSNIVLGANAVLGAGAFIALLGGDNSLLAKILIGIVAAGSAIDNTIGFAKLSKLHADLARKFTELAANMALWDATEQNYRRACSERIRIEKDEPPIRRLVDLQARNEEMRSRGYPSDDMVPLSRWQRTFGYVFTFGMPRLEKWLADRQKTSHDMTAA